MKKKTICNFLLVALCPVWSACTGNLSHEHIQKVTTTKGLIAFWDFNFIGDTTCSSKFDPMVIDQSYEVKLRRIDDIHRYTPANWPYQDTLSMIRYDHTGPFGKAIRFNLGYIYGSVERSGFDQTKLDLSGTEPFTIIAWVKFVGQRHMVAGIWDEGGWNRYEGRRQVALFAGLFGQPGSIAHISATGAASFPQSLTEGAQYARLRAIDGQPFEDHEWIAMAATFDPEHHEVIAYLNGEMTRLTVTDPVTKDVYQDPNPQQANPFQFHHAIYSPRNFLIKYNGYLHNADNIIEHSLQVNIDAGMLIYRNVSMQDTRNRRFRVLFEIVKKDEANSSLLLKAEVISGDTLVIPKNMYLNIGDKISTSLEKWHKGQWELIGSPIHKEISQGAPFTFGRALGLGSENIDHGSQLYLDGVAVFDRVLSTKELKDLSF